MTDVMKTGSAAGAGRPRAVGAGEEAETEHEVRRVLAFRLGTTIRAELDEAAVSLRIRAVALAGALSAEAGGMSGTDRGYLLEVTHLLDDPPTPEALSHEVHSHVRALARVIRKLAAMNRAADARLEVSPRPPLPVRAVPGRGTGR
ncbi:hypothetical protein [Streptomyces sp. DH7]|uniref:hypothetical protein n=1 Tax=Streptomyces sp. DH7 TaxID=2857006 RepID=UPI001E366090|nr:hypothetical protein [Streptomyces sp. DH7]